jgi:hypothetical protein
MKMSHKQRIIGQTRGVGFQIGAHYQAVLDALEQRERR